MQQELFSETNNTQEVIKNLLPKDGIVEVHHSFFSLTESDAFFEKLLNTIEWHQDSMKFYGKEVNLPRLTAWYGEKMKKYSYSGINMKVHEWTPELLFIKNRIEQHSGLQFTSVLLNLYRSGNDSVSWHRDNENVLRVNPVIASVSFGGTRMFKFRHVDDHKLLRSVELTNGTFVLMKGETQHRWEHTIPKTLKEVTPRISLTFRILF